MSMGSPSDQPDGSNWWDRLGWRWRLAAAGAGFVVLAVFALAIFVLAVRPAPPDMATVWQRRSEPSITILDKDDKLAMTRGGREGPVIPLTEMPDYLWQAFVAVEDRRFYEHGAVDPQGLIRALYVNAISGRTVQGGSTITQQLAKMLFLSPERTLVRKIQDVWIATWLENNLSKDAILTLYLNRIYLGAGCYGVEAAAQFYFGKPAKDVTLQEAAMLAALPKAPTRLAPTSNLAAAQKRAGLVLGAMREAGYLKPEQLAQALKTPARPAETEEKDSANYFADWLLDQLWSLPSAEESDRWHGKNLVIHSTYDRQLQQRAELAVMTVLDADAEKKNAKQAALVAMDASGAVRAMVGGKSYVESQFNRAYQARRQPGSTFKPFVYLAALERGMTPFDKIDDSPITIDGWSPNNASGEEFVGERTLADALAHSVNTATVRLSQEVGGPSNIVETARRLGIESPLEPNASIALGTSEVSLTELAGAYLPFMNGGYAHHPFGIRAVTTDNGEVLYKREEPAEERVVAARYAADMTAMLNDVVEEGTGQSGRLAEGRPAAGKTGTTQDYRDAWFVGYTPQLLAGVWVGNDENQPMERIAGGSIPARLFKNFMDRALYGQEIAALPTLQERAEEEGEPAVAETPQDQQNGAQPEGRECHFLFFRVRC
jgi:penicillin-binding protein 1A